MIVAALSDQHGYLPDVPPCDLLVIAGDVCPDYFRHGDLAQPDHTRQAHWLRDVFAPWLRSLPAKQIVGVAGNHDFVFERPFLLPELPWIYLQDTSVDVDGLRVWGSPWVPNLPGWAFHKSGADIADVWRSIPTDVDVLVTHGPPEGFGDYCYGQHVGSRSLTGHLARVQPLLHITGHIHPAAGLYDAHGVPLVNAAVVDDDYQLVGAVRTFDLGGV